MASGRSLVQEVEFRLEQSFRREEYDRRRKEELKSLGVKIVEEMQKRLNPKKLLEFIKNYEAQGAGIGAPMRRHHVIPLNHPIPETPEPKVPLPAPKKAPVKEPVKGTDKEDSK